MWKKQKGWGERKRYGIGAIVWQEIFFAGVYFCGLASFCVFRELIFAIFFKSRRNHWWYFRFYWVRAMEIHIFKHTTVCAPFVKPVQQIITLLLYSMNRSGRLLNYFWIFRVGDYSRWALIRGWVLIKFSLFSASVVCLFCNKTINGNNKTRRCNKTEFL